MALFDFRNKKKDSKKKDEDAKTLTNVGLSGAASEVVQRYGSAAKEHLVAYGGVDNEIRVNIDGKETGKHLTKSLKSISESKVNPEFEKQNIKQ
ncbi:hypothetical protein AGMMS50212_10220 [Spirochaetia bacterium]|nr:hypothetical protein AGMMS50212_10220 [Spirochaetia bacterium]